MANIIDGLSELFGIKDYFGFGGYNTRGRKGVYNLCSSELKTMAYKEFAIQIAINKLANALSLCDFQTLKYGKEKKAGLWYKLNIAPNKNQNSTDFWQDVVYQMVTDDKGALVIEYQGDYYVAQDYDIIPNALHGNKYKNVRLSDDWIFTFKTFEEKEVLRFKLNNNKVKYIIDNLYAQYGKILVNSVTNYNRLNSKKVWVKLGAAFNQLETMEVPVLENGKPVFDEFGNPKMTNEADLIMDDIFKNRLKNFFSEDDSAIPIEEGIDIVEGNATTNGTGKNVIANTSDIRSLFDDVINQVAQAFNIPLGIMKGDVADVEAITDNFITFGVNPLTNSLEDEGNRKLYSQRDILEGTKLKIMTDTIKNYDPIKLSNASEALMRIRTINVNDVRRWLRLEPLEEKWATEYILTKNYEEQKGGDNNEQNDGKNG